MENTKGEKENCAKKIKSRDINQRNQKIEKILHQPNRNWDEVLNFVSDWVLLTDRRGFILKTNNKVKEFTGLSDSEIIGTSFCSLIQSPTEKVPESLLQQVIQTGLAVSQEIPLTGGKWISLIIEPLKDKDGKVHKAVHIIRNITEQKKNDIISNDSDIIYYQLFQNNINAVLLTVPDGNILAANPAACRLFGRTEDEIKRLGRKCLVDLTDPRLPKAIEERNRTGKFHGELTYIRKDGTKFQGELTSLVFNDKDGNTRTCMTIQDITERKKNQELLHRSEEKFRSVVENASDGILIMQNGERVYCNPCWLEICGYSEEEYQSVPFLSQIHPEDSEFVSQTYEKFRNSETTITEIEFRLLTKSNEARFLLGKASYVRWENKPAEMIIVEDITNRKRAEQERIERVWFVESMDRINRAIQQANDIEQMMSSVLEEVLSVFECDRASLVYPCDPNAAKWRAPMERTKPEWPGALDLGLDVPMDSDVVRVYKAVLSSDDPVGFGQGNEEILPADVAERFHELSQLATVIYPKNDKPYMFVIHQCSRTRIWTQNERRLFKGIGRRLEDALTSLLIYRDLKEREGRYRELANSITDIFFAVNKDLKYTFWNKASEKLTRIRAEDAIGKSILELFPETYGTKRAEQVYRYVLSTLRPQTFINESKFGGKTYTFEISVYPSMSGLAVFVKDITERKRAEQERLEHLRFIESMDRINQAIQRTNDLEQMMGGVLDIVLSLFDCERVYLLYPCDPEADTWKVPMERSKPEFEGSVYTQKLEMPMEPGIAEMMRVIIDSEGPVKFGFGNEHPLSEQTIKRHGFQSMLTTVLYPKVGKAWQLSINQFSQPRIWTDEEVRLFQGISRRLEDALTSLLMYRDLKERENKYRELADSITDVFFAMDKNLNYTFWNKATENLTGIRAEDALGKSNLELFPNVLWAEQAAKVYRDVLLTQQPQTYINEPEFKGRSCIFEVSVYPSIGGLTVFIKDIAERRQAEKKLEESEVRYRELFENMPSGVAVYEVIDGGKDFIFKDFNRAGEQYDKQSREELIGKSIFDIRPGVEEFGLIDAFRKAIKSGKPVHYPDALYKDNHLTAWYDNYIYSLPSGELVSIFRDVTDKKKAEELLKASEVKYKTLFDKSIEGIGLSMDNRIISANRALLNFFGYDSLEEFVGIPLLDHIAPESKELVLHTMEMRKKGLSAPDFSSEIKIKRKEGKIKVLEVSGTRIRLEGEEYVLNTFRDITEQKKIEDALKKNEEKLRLMTEAIEDVFWISTPGVKEMTYISPSYEKIWGRSCQSLYDNPKSFLEAVLPEDCEILSNNLKKYHALGKPYQCEYRIQSSNDQIRWIYERGFPVHDSIGNLRYMTGVCTDITSRKLAQEALYADERLLYEVGRIAMIGGWEMDLITRKAKWTKGTYDIVEIEYSEPVPGPDEHLEYYLPEYRPVVEKAMKDLIEKDIPLDFEAKAKTAKGNIKWFRAIGRSIRKEGVCIKIFGTLQDITERKKIEASILDYQEQLKSLASQLTLSEEKERYRIATELHDHIGQHLALSIMKLQSLEQVTDSDEAQEIREQVCEWLNRTVEQIRSLTFDLSSPILYGLGFERAVAAWLADEVQKKHNIITEFQCDSLPKPLEDDVRVLLFRDVRELLFNVIKHAQAKKVKVSVAKFGSNIKIVIEDDGIGFDPVEVNATAVGKARFGLFSIRERLEHSGGHLNIDASPNKGSKITIIAPLMKGREKSKE